jgi:hypothetical protein
MKLSGAQHRVTAAKDILCPSLTSMAMTSLGAHDSFNRRGSVNPFLQAWHEPAELHTHRRSLSESEMEEADLA